MAYKDKEKARIHKREYYLKNKEEINRKNREWYHSHKNDPERIRKRREYAHKHYMENREKLLSYEKEWRKKNWGRITLQRKKQRSTPEAVKTRSDYNTQFRANLKKEVLIHYGSSGEATCEMCGEDRLSCLSLDHINNDGAKTRIGGYNFYLWLKRHNFPDISLQPLCMNCQFVKRAFYEEEQRQKRIIRRVKEWQETS